MKKGVHTEVMVLRCMYIYEAIPELPRNATGKILKQVLRGMHNETATRS
ncbi:MULTISPECIES: hypothetical protein [Anoxybacillus]|nr:MULTISPECIES: hypothetical protein [Anoxybacillus]